MKQSFSKETVWPGLIAMVAAALLALGAAGSAAAATPAPYFNGFETDTNGWTGANRVASGSNGVTSASGAFHAEAVGGPFTNWGGYTDQFPASGYTTARGHLPRPRERGGQRHALRLGVGDQHAGSHPQA